MVAATKAIQGEVKARYSNPRAHSELVTPGRPSGVRTVGRLMRQHRIAA